MKLSTYDKIFAMTIAAFGTFFALAAGIPH